MFSFQECIQSIKCLARSSTTKDTQHSQLLDLYSRELRFNSYAHLYKTLENIPPNNRAKEYSLFMRKYCQIATPKQGSCYYEFHAGKVSHSVGYSFFSSCIGWDSLGREVRVPCPVNSQKWVNTLREVCSNPIYVIENHRQLWCWLYRWHGIAIIPEYLSKKSFPDAFNRRNLVSQDVDRELILACNEDHRDNFSV